MTTFLNPHRFAAVGGDFFGEISMLREFWAEDPDWTNPGDGNDLTTLRDNGTYEDDLTAGTVGGGDLPTYQASSINGKPGFDFAATSNTVGGRCTTSAGNNTADLSVIVVGRIDSIIDSAHYPILVDSSSSNRCIVGARNAGGSGSGTWWANANSDLLINDAGTWDANPHLFVVRVATDDLRHYTDGTLGGTDSSGTAAAGTGFRMGAFATGNSSMLDGAVAYAAMYSGDITTHGDYATWTANISAHYGL